MNQYPCTITEQQLPEGKTIFTAFIRMNEECSVTCTGFHDTTTLKVCMSHLAEEVLNASLTFAHPITDA